MTSLSDSTLLQALRSFTLTRLLRGRDPVDIGVSWGLLNSRHYEITNHCLYGKVALLEHKIMQTNSDSCTRQYKHT